MCGSCPTVACDIYPFAVDVRIRRTRKNNRLLTLGNDSNSNETKKKSSLRKNSNANKTKKTKKKILLTLT